MRISIYGRRTFTGSFKEAISIALAVEYGQYIMGKK